VLDAEPLAHRAKARDILQEALRRDPQSSAANFYLGLALNLDATLPQAIELFKRSIELNPSFPSAHAHVGHVLVRTGHPAGGLEYIRYAMRLSPRDPTMTVFLEMAGHAELELDHHAAAIESFQRAAALKPAYPQPWAGLAAAHALAGRMDEARGYARRLIALQPHLGTDALIEQFGRTAGSQLRTGLSLALAPVADSWKSPPLPERHGASTARTPVIALAVLPFTAIGESGLQLTADIITEDLTNGLSRVSLLRVISRQTMRSYASGKIDVAAIGAELGVRYVLEGALRMQGDRLRVSVELINPATRLPVWSARIERDGADQDQIRDEIVGRLARELQFEVYHAESKRASTDPTFKQLIYQGWTAILSHGTEGLDALKQAEAAFLQADAREPGNQASRFGLGAYHTLIGSLQLLPDWRGHLAKAEHLLRQNIKDDPDAAGQHFYLSIVFRMRGELERASESLQRCLEIAPSMAPCHAHLGHTLVQMNRAEEGLAHIDYALRLSPRDLSRPHWLRFAGEAEIEMGHFGRATALLRQSYAANPRHPFLLRSLAAASALSGNMDESRKYIVELGTVAPHLSIERYLHRPAPLRAAQPELSRGLRMAVAPRS
jgi:TolB-like protein/Tfp pilus assembly protein PilF